MKLESLLQYLDEYLEVKDFPDYPNAMNGLQVQGTAEELEHAAFAVDVSEETIQGALDAGAGLLVVHHGLFWGGPRPVTGRMQRKLKALLCGGVALYGVHLPLDAHPEVGNSAVLARALGMELDSPFGSFEGRGIGWAGKLAADRDGLRDDLSALLGSAAASRSGGSEVKVIPGGPWKIERAGVVTGSGGSFIREAVEEGLHALITGEGSHHDYVDATELGINVYYGGHYATEIWGVRALAAHLEERFNLSWSFIDAPSGL